MSPIKEMPEKRMNKPGVEPITAAGGVVFRFAGDQHKAEVLMILRNKVWDLPKGKLEPGESIAMCAVREVAEEVGSALPAIVRKLGTTYHEYPQGEQIMGKTTHWYSMIFTSPEELIPQKEEGIEKVSWVPLSAAVSKAGYQNLKDILKKIRT